MPGIPLLDGITDFDHVLALSGLFEYLPVAVAIIEAVAAISNALRWHTRASLIGSYRETIPPRWALALHAAVILFIALAFLYGKDGRYSLTGIEGLNDGRVYFGQELNGLPHGFGKLFDAEHRIIYVGGFAAGRFDGHGRRYEGRDDGTAWLEYEGGYAGGTRSGEGREFELVGGEALLRYEGGYANGRWNGLGHMYHYGDDGTLDYAYEGGFLDDNACGNGRIEHFGEDGRLTHSYEGSWASGKKSGYGTDIRYEGDAIRDAYRGLHWDDKRHGEGIYEYHSASGTLVLWRGVYDGGERTSDFAYYREDGSFWAVGKNGSLVVSADGEEVEDEARIAELEERWPLPSTRLMEE